MAKLPEAFLENMKELLTDEEYEAYLKSFDSGRVWGLRVNTLKISVEDFLKISPFHLKPVPWTENGFYYEEEDRPSHHPYYYAGLYYLQEPSAMTPAAVLPITPGDRVLDVCAAPGGKSTELAAKTQGKGILYSNDISNSRALALLKNLELFGTRNTVILTEDPVKMAPEFENCFDKILIDAPCSGEGMFRKEPAVIKAWIEHGNEFYVKLQKQITEACLKMLRPGGEMVYSTCTFSPLEDENMILYMKSLCPELTVEEIPGKYRDFCDGMPDKAASYDEELRRCIRIFPHRTEGEGHFVALLKKGEEEKTEIEEAVHIKKAVLSEETEAFFRLIDPAFMTGNIDRRNEKIYLVPEGVRNMSGLRVLRSGLLLGEEKKNRFEPSQALAMALREKDFDFTVSLPASDDRVLRYLKGETLDVSDVTERSGWVLFCVDHYPLGFAKSSGGRLKNKYLPGWRYLSN